MVGKEVGYVLQKRTFFITIQLTCPTVSAPSSGTLFFELKGHIWANDIMLPYFTHTFRLIDNGFKNKTKRPQKVKSPKLSLEVW